MTIAVRPTVLADRELVRRLTIEHWGSEIAVAHGQVFRPAECAGFLAEEDGRVAGLLTYRVDGDACEIVTVDAYEPRRGIGTALVGAVKALGHSRVRLTTTNDNVGAQRFYERSGFRLVDVRQGAVARSRELKPEIPQLGENGVPIRDELEYEYRRVRGSGGGSTRLR